MYCSVSTSSSCTTSTNTSAEPSPSTSCKSEPEYHIYVPKRTQTEESAPSKETQRKCRVCATVTKHFHMEALICRACATFYKRALAENAVFQCSARNNCDMKSGNSRIRCRACRFNRCAQATLAPRLGHAPRCTSLALIDKNMVGYSNYIRSQALLVAQQHPELALDEDTIILPKQKFIRNVKRQSASILIAMLNLVIPGYAELDMQKKVRLVSAIHYELSTWHEIALTIKYFPQQRDPRCMFTTHYAVDYDTMEYEWFLDGVVSMEVLSSYLTILTPLVNRFRALIERARQMQLAQEDVVVMMSLATVKHMDYLGDSTPAIHAFRDEIMAEWVLHLSARVDNPLEFVTRLMLLYSDVDNLSIEYKNAETVMKAYQEAEPKLPDKLIAQFADQLKL